jgi:lipopolysaccharide/colanic/teichoic acid biosynthesis glycosyltransferase
MNTPSTPVSALLIRTGMARWLEVVISGLGIILSIPLLILAAVAITITAPGPVIFRQDRVGRHGQIFVLYKLRTMRTGHDGPQVTATGDERVTWVGRILRRTKVDELPELWNVLKGDMALVGPRPEVPRYVDLEDHRWKFVLSSRPGITDPMTLRLRNEEGLLGDVKGNYESFYINNLLPFKLQGYIDYLHNRSWWSDIKVLCRTVFVIVWPRVNTQTPANEVPMLVAQHSDEFNSNN